MAATSVHVVGEKKKEVLYPLVHYKGGIIMNIRDYMKDHFTELDTFNIKEEAMDYKIRVRLASDFGEYSADKVALLSRNTKIAVGTVAKLISRYLYYGNHDRMLSLLMGDSAVRKVWEKTNERMEEMKVEDDSTLSTDGKSAKPADVVKVSAFLKKVLDDQEIYDALLLDKFTAQLARIIHTKSKRTAWRTIQGSVTHDAQLMEVNVIRFPDTQHEYFYLYTLSLHAWENYDTLRNDDTTGLRAVFKWDKFEPNGEIIKLLDPHSQKAAHDFGVDFYKIKNKGGRV